MANPVRKPKDIVAQLDAIAAKDPVSQLSVKRRAAVQPDISWLTKSSPLAPQGQTSNLLAQLDANPYIKKDLPPPPKPGAGVSALKHLLMPLQILDTPRRAVISGVRELVDVMDSDPNTNASFGDWWGQTKDFDYGTGKAFPMKGWGGRILGFIGDVAFDPLTYATLGGTVAKKATMLDDLGRVVKTRSLLGKSVIGREGRFKLSEFAKNRMRNMNKNGLANFTEQEIRTAGRDIAARGKSALSEALAKDMGIKGPGIYYFGSRVKVPGTGVLGKFVERGITNFRLGAVKTTGVSALHNLITPRGTGHYAQFGTDAIRDARVALARGDLTPDDAYLASTILHVDDLRRIRVSEVTSDVEGVLGPTRDFAVDPMNSSIMRQMLDNIPTPEIPAEGLRLGATADQIAAAVELRTRFDGMWENADIAMREVDPDYKFGYVGEGFDSTGKGYVPKFGTDQFKEWLEMMDAGKVVITDPNAKTDMLRLVSNLKSRTLHVGDSWFGVVLKPEDMTIDAQNAIIRNVLGFDAWHSEMREILPRYVRNHAEQLGTAAMMKGVIEREGADFLSVMSKRLRISDSYAMDMAEKSKEAFTDSLNSLINLHSGLQDSVRRLRSVLTIKHGDFESALRALQNPNISQADVDALEFAMREAFEVARVSHAEFQRLSSLTDDILESDDGFSVFSRIADMREMANVYFSSIEDAMSNIGVKLSGSSTRAELIGDALQTWRTNTAKIAVITENIKNALKAADVIPPLARSGADEGPTVYSLIKNRMSKIGPKGSSSRDYVQYGGSFSRMRDVLSARGMTSLLKDVKILDLWDARRVSDVLLDSVVSGGQMTDDLSKAYHWLFLKSIQDDLLNGSENVLQHYSASDLHKGTVGALLKSLSYDTKSGVPTMRKALDPKARLKLVYGLQDVLMYHMNRTEVQDVSEFMLHYGITVGADVQRDIIKKNSYSMLLAAELARDTVRVAQLMDESYGLFADGSNYLSATVRLFDPDHFASQLIAESRLAAFGIEDIKRGLGRVGNVDVGKSSRQVTSDKALEVLDAPTRVLYDARRKDLLGLVEQSENELLYLRQRESAVSDGMLQLSDVHTSKDESFRQSLATFTLRPAQTSTDPRPVKRVIKWVDFKKPYLETTLDDEGLSVLRPLTLEQQKDAWRLENKKFSDQYDLAVEYYKSQRLARKQRGVEAVEMGFARRIDFMRNAFDTFYPESEFPGGGAMFDNFVLLRNDLLQAGYNIGRRIEAGKGTLTDGETRLIKRLADISGILTGPLRPEDAVTFIEDYFREGLGSITKVMQDIQLKPLQLKLAAAKGESLTLSHALKSSRFDLESLTPTSFLRLQQSETLNAMPVVPPVGSAELSQARREMMELDNSPDMVVHKSSRNVHDALFVLRGLDGHKVNWQAEAPFMVPRVVNRGGLQPFTVSESTWNSIMLGNPMDENARNIVSNILTHVKSPEVLAVTSAKDVERFGVEGISSELAIRNFVLHKIRIADGAADISAYQVRGRMIAKKWYASDSFLQLSKLNDAIASVNARMLSMQREDSVRLLEIASQANDAHIERIVSDMADISVWHDSQSVALSDDVQEFLMRVNDATKKSTDLRDAEDDIASGLARDFDTEVQMDVDTGETLKDFAANLKIIKLQGPQLDGVTLQEQFAAQDYSSAAARIDEVLQSPMSTKSARQLTDEIEALTSMKSMRFGTPYVDRSTVTTLIRERRRALRAIEFSDESVEPIASVRSVRSAPRNGLPNVPLAKKGKPQVDQNGKEYFANAIFVGDRGNPDGGFGIRRKYSNGQSFWKPTDRELKNHYQDTSGVWTEVKYRSDPNLPGSQPRWITEQGDPELWYGVDQPEWSARLTSDDSGAGVVETYREDGQIDWMDALSATDNATPYSVGTYPTYGIGADPYGRTKMAGWESSFAQLEQDFRDAGGGVVGSKLRNPIKTKRAKTAADDALKLAKEIEVRFDSVKGLVQPVDRQAIKETQDRLAEVAMMLRRTTGSVDIRRLGLPNKPVTGSRVLNQYAGGASVLNKEYERAMVTMREGIQLLKDLGSTSAEITPLERVLRLQLRQEADFWATVTTMQSAEFDDRMVQGLKSLIFSGDGTLGVDGVVRDAAGVAVNSVPPQYVEAVRNLKSGFTTLGERFPSLTASPQFYDLWQKIEVMEDPEYLIQLVKYVGGFTKFHKAYATMTPGFHVRNGLANGVKLMFMGAEWRNLHVATPMYFHWMQASKSGILWDDFVKTLPEDLQKSAIIARKAMHGSGGGIFTETFKDATRTSKLWDNRLVRFNANLGQQSDNYSRFVLAFDSAQKGMDVGLAQARVKRAFFDYEDLSQLDEVMRLIVPFWLWTSRNLVFELQNQWLNPKPYQIFRSFMRNMRDPDYEPSEYPSPFIREMGGIKMPFGDNLYFAPDLGFTRTGQQLTELYNPLRYTNNFNPLLKIPLEQALGRSVFTGQELTTPRERLEHMLKGGIPPLNQGDRLFGSEGDSAKNAWLSYIGSPVRTYQTKEK